ncbi:hypothetical protein HJ588_07795 [Flexivirga sp. ID2601S]|uniref:Uncharacterized protein n=1 Tax=Flexivirga aerilata TaxID=1656889 RepID=A0A849AFB1_9MICO|nr:hypothetical protein [Flexivirga aerilata]NNG39175.1 hypothetical protein [Flexivirga aerilata]
MTRKSPPRPVVNALRLMYAAAALAVVGIAVTAGSRGAIRDSLRESNASRPAGDRLDAAEVRRAADLAGNGFLTMAIVAAVLWLVMALLLRSGRPWTRIVATVLAVLNVLLAIGMVTRGVAAMAAVQSLTAVVGLLVVALLWQRRSTRFFDGPVSHGGGAPPPS